MNEFKQALAIRRRGIAFDVIAFTFFFSLWTQTGWKLGVLAAGFMLAAKTFAIYSNRHRIIADANARSQSNEPQA